VWNITCRADVRGALRVVLRRHKLRRDLDKERRLLRNLQRCAGRRAAALCSVGRTACVTLAVAGFALPVAQAQDARSSSAAAVGAGDPGQKIVRAVRTLTPPSIDGKLDDAVWAAAAVLTDFHQVNPIEYAPSAERMEIRLLYDDDALYVGAKMFQPPGAITRNTLRQNGNITQDDTLFVTIDPFNQRRAGYFFGVNANGVRFDGLYRNVSEYYSDWDSIFYAETSIVEDGYVIEYAIPFKSISFDPNTDTWGLNFSRSIQNIDEDSAWVSRNRRWDPSTAGLMTGLRDLDQGVGLDVVPSASMVDKRVALTGTPDSHESDFEPSLDVFYKITPQLNGSLTVNTDFSATEVDDRQVNLTRFGLFFPEKRDFFLREADIFEFGRIGASDGTGALSNAERQNARPFFSRRIGLGNTGEPVDVEYGGKVSGRIGGFELGALSIRQDEDVFSVRQGREPPGAECIALPVEPGADPISQCRVAADTLSVVRAKAGIGGESTVGAIFTNGDPLSNVDNSLAGVDFLYRNSRLPGGRTIEAGAWYQESDTEGLIDDNRAAGFGISVPSNAKFRGGLSVRDVEANFYPALGWISRRDTRDYQFQLAYTHRPGAGYWQQMFWSVDGQRVEHLGGGLESQQVGLTPLRITNRTGDYIFVRSNFAQEVLDAPFPISPGIVIPIGDYAFDDHGLEFGTSSFRKVSGRIAYTDGEFYDGTRSRLFGNVMWTPSPKFSTNFGYNLNFIELPHGTQKFTTRIITTSIDWVFSSKLSWTNLIQYDNVSEIAGLNVRLNWIPEAGQEFFFVINHNLEDLDRDNSFHTATSDVVAKLSYTFRF
jgi:cellulose/xylan binding protein with CBM9 domain/uncharacterized protein DUF5916